MSRSQVHLSLPPLADGILEELAAQHHLTKSEVARQAILLLFNVLNYPQFAHEAIKLMQSQLGVTTNG